MGIATVHQKITVTLTQTWGAEPPGTRNYCGCSVIYRRAARPCVVFAEDPNLCSRSVTRGRKDPKRGRQTKPLCHTKRAHGALRRTPVRVGLRVLSVAHPLSTFRYGQKSSA